jgi:hypothetical protein
MAKETETAERVAVDQMMETFGEEERSNDILTDRNDRDAGETIPTPGGTVKRVPTGYVDELRKGRKQRAALDSYQARPSSVGLFAWNGVPSEVPIAYQPGGTNPSISRYLRKKHCLACGISGFIAQSCPTCGSGDVIRFFYRSYDEVPHKRDWYGDTPCLCSESGAMVGDCPRDGKVREGQAVGFLSVQQMLMHASSKHPREYGIWQVMGKQQPATPVDIAALRKQITAEVLADIQRQSEPEPSVKDEAPLYVSDKDRVAAS